MGFVNPNPAKEEEKKEERKEESEADAHIGPKKPDFTNEEVEQMMKLAKKRDVSGGEAADKEFTVAGFDPTMSTEDQAKEIGNINNEALVIPQPCYHCSNMGVQKTCVSHIPHFKEIIIMAFT